MTSRYWVPVFPVLIVFRFVVGVCSCPNALQSEFDTAVVSKTKIKNYIHMYMSDMFFKKKERTMDALS